MATRKRHCIDGLVLLFGLLAAAATAPAHADTTEELIERGRERFSEQRYEKAARLFSEADRAANGESFLALDGLARSLVELGRYDELVEVGERMTAASEQPAQRSRGFYYIGMGRLHQARRAVAPDAPERDARRRQTVEAFQQGLTLDSTGLNEVRPMLAETLIDLGDSEPASAVLEEYGALGGRAELADRLRCWLGYAIEMRTAKEAAGDTPRPEVAGPRRLTKPEFPCPSERFSRGSATLMVAGVVDEQGQTRCVRVLTSPPGCEAVALAEVAAWRWEPARRSTEPVPVFFQEEFGIARR